MSHIGVSSSGLVLMTNKQVAHDLDTAEEKSHVG